MPKFKLACEDDYSGKKFVCIYDNIDANYGDLQYIFTYWVTIDYDELLFPEFEASSELVSDGYEDIELYAWYKKAQELTFVRYGENSEENKTKKKK